MDTSNDIGLMQDNKSNTSDQTGHKIHVPLDGGLFSNEHVRPLNQEVLVSSFNSAICCGFSRACSCLNVDSCSQEGAAGRVGSLAAYVRPDPAAQGKKAGFPAEADGSADNDVAAPPAFSAGFSAVPSAAAGQGRVLDAPHLVTPVLSSAGPAADLVTPLSSSRQSSSSKTSGRLHGNSSRQSSGQGISLGSSPSQVNSLKKTEEERAAIFLQNNLEDDEGEDSLVLKRASNLCGGLGVEAEKNSVDQLGLTSTTRGVGPKRGTKKVVDLKASRRSAS